MKTIAIYNVWSDWDLLELSMKNILPMVDGVLVVFSRNSNFGEFSPEPLDFMTRFDEPSKITMINAEPVPGKSAMQSETAKRNCGLHHAKILGYTHFLMMDADEFYVQDEIFADMECFKSDPELLGLVGKVKCYFRLPTLTIGYDVTLVPLIHKITPGLKFEFNRQYPFAWTEIDGVAFTEKKRIRIDPTRAMNINSGVKWSSTTMHHFSWVRKDIMKKVRNSTARQNLEQSTIVKDYLDATAGKYCQFYKTKIESCENLFNIPAIIDGDLKSLHDQGSTDRKED